MGTSTQLFSVTIRDNSGEDPIVFSGHTSDLPWILLCQFQDNYLIYDWAKFVWKSISYADFVNYRGKYQYLLIQTGIFDKFWLEFPMTHPHPKRIDNSKIKDKKRRIEPINSYFRSSQTEDGLQKFIETERLLSELARQDYE